MKRAQCVVVKRAQCVVVVKRTQCVVVVKRAHCLCCGCSLVKHAKGVDALVAMKDLAGCYHATGLLHSKMDDLDGV